MDSKDINKLNELVKSIKIAMLVTNDGQHLRSRPMGTQELDGQGFLWFFTEKDNSLVHEISSNPSVNVSYSDISDDTYVSVSGEAKVVMDKRKVDELWNPALKAWFPQGKDDPKICLLQIEISQAEYWDVPGNKMVQLIGMVKAAVTGAPYQPGENKKIQ